MTNNFNLSELVDKRKASENEITTLAKEKNLTYEEAWNMYYTGVWKHSEEKELLISLGVYKEGNFTRRKSFEEWYFDDPKVKVNITLPILFKLATMFDVEVGRDWVELRSR